MSECQQTDGQNKQDAAVLKKSTREDSGVQHIKRRGVGGGGCIERMRKKIRMNLRDSSDCD